MKNVENYHYTCTMYLQYFLIASNYFSSCDYKRPHIEGMTRSIGGTCSSYARDSTSGVPRDQCLSYSLFFLKVEFPNFYKSCKSEECFPPCFLLMIVFSPPVTICIGSVTALWVAIYRLKKKKKDFINRDCVHMHFPYVLDVQRITGI